MDASEGTAVVCDAGPIIHLDELDALGLLAGLTPWVPEAVWAEAQRHRPRALGHPAIATARCSSPEDEIVLNLAAGLRLGPGECAALALARSTAAIVLTDDAAARLAAESLGLRVHGSLGIIVRAPRVGLVTPQAVISLLQEIPRRSSLHLRPALLAEIVERVRTSYGL